MKRLLTISFVLTCIACNMNAQVINIPADHPTIQAGIESAADGDTVLVEEGTWFENINFLGKAITVASHFILDGDSSHISNTIIDGSQSTHPDTSSAVMMISGEDTTSVLMGFTLTGGKGTIVKKALKDFQDITLISGGGILILNSGGKIAHNIVERIHLSAKNIWGPFGCGIFASVNNNHTVIIRNNTIRENSGNGQNNGYGAGIALVGGKGIIENNTVVDNRMYLQGYSGAGIVTWSNSYPGTINKVIIRNNYISGNRAYSNLDLGVGGGISLLFDYDDAQVYNNVLAENFAEGFGGGVYGYTISFSMENNTLMNNQATVSGKSVWLDPGCHMVMFNNIIWGADSDVEEFGFYDIRSSTIHTLHLSHNILRGFSDPKYPITYEGNTYLEPLFEEGSYSSAQNSPATGRGVDSLEFKGEWYHAPKTDIAGNLRPNAIDPYMDIGACESGFSRVLLTNADLIYIKLRDYQIDPDFHCDSLYYSVTVLDTCTTVPDIEAFPADPLAQIEITDASDILSNNVVDRTSVITVTSSDNTTHKVYRVLFNSLSTVNTLSSLEVEGYSLDPPFDSETFEYDVELPSGTTEAPGVTAVASDEKAELKIYDATFADESHMTTTVVVTPEAGRSFNKSYRIAFHVAEDPGVGVPESGNSPNLKLFPNPFSTSATVEWDQYSGIERIEMLNMLGETVRVIEQVNPGSPVIIPRENLPAGIYFLRVRAEQTYVFKALIE